MHIKYKYTAKPFKLIEHKDGDRKGAFTIPVLVSLINADGDIVNQRTLLGKFADKKLDTFTLCGFRFFRERGLFGYRYAYMAYKISTQEKYIGTEYSSQSVNELCDELREVGFDINSGSLSGKFRLGDTIRLGNVLFSREESHYIPAEPMEWAEWISNHALSRYALANATGISQSVLSRAVSGKTILSKKNIALLKKYKESLEVLA